MLARQHEKEEHCTDNMFPMVEQFENAVTEKKKMGFGNTVAWRELSIDSVYKIESTRTVPNAQCGDATILQMRTNDGTEIAVSATRLLADDLKDMKLPCYVRPRGLVQSRTNANSSYHAYELLVGDVFEQ